ncbi:MAG: butyrate kinase [Thermotogae bacterium]|nr:butyrate kinase [Thermotogota bacterium]MCP5465687.1 butyrate kinase [Thermotogota bacterium]
MFRILVINPGSTSTKLAIFEDEIEVLNETVRHSSEELSPFGSISEQYGFRKSVIEKFLNRSGYPLSSFSAVIGRGGLLKPIKGGVYEIDSEMLSDLKNAKYGEHASNLGALIAFQLAKEVGIQSFIADPVVVDELSDEARISGHPDIQRRSVFHALNQKAIARQTAQKIGKKYEDSNIIVIHLGGGISVGAHKKGLVVDVNNALDGDGPFTPERSGTVPLTGLIELCFSGKYDMNQVKKLLKGKGGLVAYLNTNDAQNVQKMINSGDEKARTVYSAMAMQIAKWVGKMSTAMNFEVDGIAITGGIAYDNNFMVPWIKERVEFIAPVFVFPGGEEEKALAMGALRILQGTETVKNY